MKVEVRIVSDDGRDDLKPRDRQVIHVETHSRRNDAFNVTKVDDVQEGSDPTVFMIPSGGRLVINTPFVGGDVVYDPDQAAAVRPSQQANDEGRADKVNFDQVAKDKQDEADRAKRMAEEQKERNAEANKSAEQKAEEQRKAEAARSGMPPPTGTAQPQQTGGQSTPQKAPQANPAANTPNPSPTHGANQTPPQQRK